MYTVLVVDDFALDRQQMIEALRSFSDLPLELVGECENGVEALDMIRDLKPDILLCDVEMPHISGLELAEKLRQDQNNIRIIFCSLYDKLHYLKAAISVHSDGYIMKPFTALELHECISKVLMNLINIEKQKHELECLRTDMYENHELMEKQALSDLIYGYAIEKNELESCSNILRVKPDATYRLALMEIDDYFSKLYTDTGEPENTLVNYRVMHILENHARREDGTHLFRPVRLNEKCFILIFGLGMEWRLQESKTLTDNMLQLLIREAHAATISLTATYGDHTSGLQNMKAQLELCRYRLDYKLLLGKGQVIYASEVPGRTPQQSINVVEIQRQVRLLLNDMDSDFTMRCKMLVSKALGALPLLQAQIYCQYIFTCNQIVLQENGAELTDIIANPSEFYLHMLSATTIEQYESMVILLLTSTHAFLNRQDRGNKTQFIQEVKKYIQSSDLSLIHLHLVAEKFSYSPNYLNHIFKEETGKTILDYIIDCRIEQAKKMLHEPGARVGEVAEKLGYNQATYFSMVFKKHEGITPKKYMERVK